MAGPKEVGIADKVSRKCPGEAEEGVKEGFLVSR